MTYPQKGKKLLFEEETIRQPSDKVSQKAGVAVVGGGNHLDKDMTEHEWAMQYFYSEKKVALFVTQQAGRGQLAQVRPFSYGRILRLDYKDPNTYLIILVDYSHYSREFVR